MKKWDFLLIAGLLCLAAILYFSGALRPGEAGAAAVITLDRKEVARLPLDQAGTYTTPDGSNTVTVANGTAQMTYSDCPDQICVHQGKISKEGQTIVCLPNRLVVEIIGGEETGVDAISQ